MKYKTCNTLEDMIEKFNLRQCICCGKPMIDGYCIGNGLLHYCSDECLYESMPKEEYLFLYNEGHGDSYYTNWYDSKESIDRYREAMNLYNLL